MATERPDAGKSYHPLPIHEIHKENSALPAINVQMAQLSTQLTQLIDQLQRLNNQMQNFQEEKKITQASDSLQTTTRENRKIHDYSNKEDQLTEIKVKSLRKRRRLSKLVNGRVIGIAAALYAAIAFFSMAMP